MPMNKNIRDDAFDLYMTITKSFEKAESGICKYYFKIPGSGISAVFEDGKYVGWYRYE